MKKLILTDQQLALFDFVKLKHGDQKRKYTNEPYYHHLVNVACIVAEHEPNGIETALCHDLFEDTNCDFDALYKRMTEIGYTPDKAYKTCTYVNELTDKFTKEAYPEMNRKARKAEECRRLARISYLAQSVKYADLIDNSKDILKHDKGFGEVYLKEKQEILNVVDKGNQTLYNQCLEQINNLSSI